MSASRKYSPMPSRRIAVLSNFMTTGAELRCGCEVQTGQSMSSKVSASIYCATWTHSPSTFETYGFI